VALPAKPMVCPCVRLRDRVAAPCLHDLLLKLTSIVFELLQEEVF
jgi:hypothetical protein